MKERWTSQSVDTLKARFPVMAENTCRQSFEIEILIKIFAARSMAVDNFCNDRKFPLMLTSALIYMLIGINKIARIFLNDPKNTLPLRKLKTKYFTKKRIQKVMSLRYNLAKIKHNMIIMKNCVNQNT